MQARVLGTWGFGCPKGSIVLGAGGIDLEGLEALGVSKVFKESF